ncbi:hypothetical protein EGR_05560 [Echinococcus granulosus]|uniref:Single strand binding protein n=1 Tax=Echinococcus granulosus TaxID=6210 RepID=U6J912_ECHGR|nr:hypothetical protein EGR_05560 [Echinococcus granulosus]EUB59533.1 hypothetical protein EGR_05560 [Echinococcus granulosus]CDS20520.1 single strand binding protein [Echinococcus granulosus]
MLGRCLTGFRHSSLRQHWRSFSDSGVIFSSDINQITLLGSVASSGVAIEKSQSGRPTATFSLLTRARYRGADRYKMKLVYHRIQVFDKPLIERIKNVSLGDRVFVQGCLSSFKKSTNDWMQAITAQNIILHSEAGRQSAKESVMGEVGEEEKEGTAGESF